MSATDQLTHDEIIATVRAAFDGHYALRRAIDQRIAAELEIAPATAEVLLRLLSALPQHAIATTALAAEVSFSSGGFTRLVDRLEQAGLVERLACPGDRRVVWVGLTAEGQRVARRASELVETAIREDVLAVISTERLAELRDIMSALRDGLGGGCPDGQ